jgi:excisionase family DNA binding protein
MNGEQLWSNPPGNVERLAAPRKNSVGGNGANRPVVDYQATSRADWPLTVPEIAERLRVGRKWVYEHADQLGAYRVGKYLRFDWDHVKERLRSGAVAVGKLGSQPNGKLIRNNLHAHG